MRRLPVLLLLALAMATVGSSAAQANPQVQFSIMMDDDHLLYRGDDVRDETMRRMKEMGVDYVRVSVLWNVVAHKARKGKRQRRRFRADNPRTYPRGNWDRYDRLVRAGRTLGIGIYFNVTGPGPRWAHRKAPKSQRKYQDTWDPKAKEFYKFVKAVGKRYDGTYVDENDERQALPRVSFWAIYNEPNQPGWLTPQYRGSTPWSPVLYRELWRQGRAALDDSGHEGDVVLIGETAPLGNSNTNPASPMYPKKFIREFFCVDSRYRPYRGASARRRDCDNLDKIGDFRYTAWAHHPYTKKLSPTSRDSARDAITMANIGELSAMLDAIGAKVNTVPTQNFTALTEFGYETNPPDRFSGISPALQSEYINVGDYIAYKESRVIANTQFLLRDVKGVKGFKKSDKRRWFTYQSGLFYANGKPKPSAIAYRMPLHIVSTEAAGVNFWGWLRFLPAGTQTQVLLQFRPAGASEFQTIGDPVAVTNPNGFFEAQRPRPGPGTWRALFIEPISGTPVASREIAG
jgi:hypothetical protein